MEKPSSSPSPPPSHWASRGVWLLSLRLLGMSGDNQRLHPPPTHTPLLSAQGFDRGMCRNMDSLSGFPPWSSLGTKQQFPYIIIEGDRQREQNIPFHSCK